ncbi:helix-turn-helix transcriptional regulator [Clostridioides difficile]|uniref:helix-turn-helix transcriptional regulator n=1 Tax=Clostridioides difficile TaxID=1496 RepID=UPI001C196AED|nr:helix-turn-helix transcriptional regulator [Clostridioides difficile]MBY2516602.1 helix-turn-helix domain-containing protein [Clostridioides difficile]MCR1466550.1 helix-turn-helix domain-containing protein [Clostridioides difficile]MDL0355332.1 helix-turn-helix transcriptional regulator [Clostridioides difficile]HBF4444537.1 helix-turn-helix transcriptional regulator [Clostridioides difficile]HBG0376309.1 helix-turn-helix transcriptional regulator [Clostridioides difficile]
MSISFGEKIKIILKRKNMTIGELAEKTGQTRQNLSNKFSRDNFSEKEIREFAEILDCEFNFYFTMNDTEETI